MTKKQKRVQHRRKRGQNKKVEVVNNHQDKVRNQYTFLLNQRNKGIKND